MFKNSKIGDKIFLYDLNTEIKSTESITAINESTFSVSNCSLSFNTNGIQYHSNIRVYIDESSRDSFIEGWKEVQLLKIKQSESNYYLPYVDTMHRLLKGIGFIPE